MTGIQTPIGGWHRTPHIKTKPVWPAREGVVSEAPTLDIPIDATREFPMSVMAQPEAPKLAWWTWFIPAGDHGIVQQLLSLLLTPITAPIFLICVFGMSVLKPRKYQA